MPEYILPDPPYDPGALEPYYSREIIELHHGKHHAAYVAGANTTLEKLADARAKGDFGAIVGLEKALSFNISDHVLSTTFAASMRSTTPVSPTTGGRGRGGGLVGACYWATCQGERGRSELGGRRTAGDLPPRLAKPIHE